jgi:hypothetical protein
MFKFLFLLKKKNKTTLPGAYAPFGVFEQRPTVALWHHDRCRGVT